MPIEISRKSQGRPYSLRSDGVDYDNLEIFYHYRTVRDLCKKGSGICLDLGARDTNLKHYLENLGYRYVGVDIDYYACLDVVADGSALPFKDEAFDVVILAQVLEHVLRPQSVMNEIWRVLKKGGALWGSASFLEPFHNSYFNASYRAVEYLLREANFQKIHIEAGVTAFVLILARIFGMGGCRNHRLFSGAAKILFPLKYVLKAGYYMLGVKNRILGKDMKKFRENVRDHYESIALSLAGHILFSAKK